MSSAQPITTKFDFRHYIPSQNLSAGTINFDGSICELDSLSIVVLAENLVPGRAYRTTYQLISPTTEQNVFNPSVSTLFASQSSQSFVTSAKLPKVANINNYIIKATTKDLTEGSNIETSSQINIICGINKPTFTLEMLDPDLQPVPPDNIINIGECSTPYPLVCLIKDAKQNKEYAYEFFTHPEVGVFIENKIGTVFAGDINQNFNTKIALTGFPYVFVHAEVKEIDTGIVKNSQPVLLKCYQTNPCDVVLPTGVHCDVGAPTFKKCSNRGLTTSSISNIYGGRGFSIGDTLTTTGGGGYGAEIELLFGGITQDTFSSFVGGSGFNIGDLIEVTGGGGSGGLVKLISGGLTAASINSLNGCSDFKIGDYLTTVGGGGSDALIKVIATGINGSISASNIEVINPGHNYTNAPSGIQIISGNGSCASASFNSNNFTIPCVGGITYKSSDLRNGTGYNIGEILSINGGGGSGAQAQILTGSLTQNSISISGGSGYNIGDYLSTSGGSGLDVVISVSTTGNNGSISTYSILNPGYGFTSQPTGLIRLSGSGVNAVLSANSNNFSITPNGSITKSSISGLLNTGTGYTVGTNLLVIGGSGSGGLLEIISVNNNGAITDYIIKNRGQNYITAPSIYTENQVIIPGQISWNFNKFTKFSYVIINGGCGYVGNPSAISSNGDGTGVLFDFDPIQFTDYAFIVTNNGSGYTSAPTGIIVRSGDGSGAVATFNDNNFTIPCTDGITYASVDGLLGKSSFLLGEELIVAGNIGEGSGGRIKVTGVNNGQITSFVILEQGCGYTVAPVLKRLDGSIISGVSFDTADFTDDAIIVINPGFGFFEAPNGLMTLTGNGSTEDIFIQFDINNFIEILGPNPTPSSTPTPTVTPTQSEPARCDDLQTAGGVNESYASTIAEIGNIGQNYIVVANVNGLNKYSIVSVPGVPAGTYITKVESWFANFDNRTTYKKLTLNNTVTSLINLNTVVNIYATDVRLIQVPFWPGIMTFTFDAYSIPDRFLVFAVPIDSSRSDTLLFDSGYRGSPGDYNYITSDLVIPGGDGEVTLTKPDGCVLIKVVVEAPAGGTAWIYNLSCPQRVFLTATPTRTPTQTPTITPTITTSPTLTQTPTSSTI